MARWLGFFTLLAVAGTAFMLGIRAESGFDHAWLTLALFAAFWSTQARFWKPPRR